MNDEFANRLTSFVTALSFANEAERKPVWENQVPKSFGTKLAESAAAVTALQAWVQAQGGSIAGAAEAKESQETDLESAAYTLAQALVTCLMDAGQLEAAEPFRRAFSWWQRLRDQELLARAQALIDAATPLTTGANATAHAENYGISAAQVSALVQERADYAAVVSAPAAARAGRKAFTSLMREKFRPVGAKFRDLDRLAIQFRARPNGAQFVEGWFAARQVIDAGHGAGSGGDNGGGGPPQPTVPGKAQITNLTGNGTSTVEFDMTAVGATLFDLYAKLPGSNDSVLIAADLTDPHYTWLNVAGSPYLVKAIGKNAQGAGPESDEVNFTGPA